jgi:hypothetical protein
MSRRFLRGEFITGDEHEEEDELDLQAGHTSNIADRIYGVRSDILSSLSEHSVEIFGSISRRWHQVLLPVPQKPPTRKRAASPLFQHLKLADHV